MLTDELAKLVEPGAGNATANHDRTIQLSIAISLKRLADAVCGDEQNTGIHHAILDISERDRT